MTNSQIRHERKADIAAALKLRGIELSQARTEIAMLKALVREQDFVITNLRATRPESAESLRVQVRAREELNA
jgi:hypothetical protein